MRVDTGLQREIKRLEMWRKGSICLTSSARLEWQGIAIERHVAEPGEVPNTSTSHIIVELASGRRSSHGERPVARGRFIPYTKRPGSLNVYAEGVLPLLYPSTRTELIVCALDRATVAKIAAEQDGPVEEAPREVIGLRDDGVAGLITLLEQEARLVACNN